MGLPLQYDVRSVGWNQLKREMASVEATSRRINRVGAAGMRSGVGAEAAAQAKLAKAKEVQLRREEARRAAMIAKMHALEDRERNKDDRARMRAIEIEERRRLRMIEREQMARERAAALAARQQAALALRQQASQRAMLGGAVGRATRGTFGMVRGGATMLGLGGGFLFAGAARHAIQTEKVASGLAVKAFGTPGETRTKEEIQASIMRTAREEGVRTGFGVEGITRALSGFVAKTGELAGGERIISTLGDIADATGGDIGEVGDVAGILVQSMRSKGLSLTDSLTQTTIAMNAFAQQAKEGSIEFAELTAIGSKIISPAARFSGDLGRNIAMLGGVAQQAIAGGASSAEEAGTAVMRFADDLIKNSKRFDQMGVKLWEGKAGGRLRAPEELIMESISRTKGDIRRLTEVYGIRAFKAVEPFTQRYMAASEKAGGGTAGHEAGMRELKDVFDKIRKTSMAGEEIRKSAAFRRAAADKQFAIALEQFNQAAGRELLPVLTKLVPKLAELIPAATGLAKKFVQIASWTIDNPFAGLAALFGGWLAKELVKASVMSYGRGLVGGAAATVGQAAVSAGGAAAAGAGGGVAARVAGKAGISAVVGRIVGGGAGAALGAGTAAAAGTGVGAGTAAGAGGTAAGGASGATLAAAAPVALAAAGIGAAAWQGSKLSAETSETGWSAIKDAIIGIAKLEDFRDTRADELAKQRAIKDRMNAERARQTKTDEWRVKNYETASLVDLGLGEAGTGQSLFGGGISAITPPAPKLTKKEAAAQAEQEKAAKELEASLKQNAAAENQLKAAEEMRLSIAQLHDFLKEGRKLNRGESPSEA